MDLDLERRDQRHYARWSLLFGSVNLVRAILRMNSQRETISGCSASSDSIGFFKPNLAQRMIIVSK
jgi:hypothetical protein